MGWWWFVGGSWCCYWCRFARRTPFIDREPLPVNILNFLSVSTGLTVNERELKSVSWVIVEHATPFEIL
jgi:hypothetical protein